MNYKNFKLASREIDVRVFTELMCSHLINFLHTKAYKIGTKLQQNIATFTVI